MTPRGLLLAAALPLSLSRLALAVAPGYVELNFEVDTTTNSGSSGSAASTTGGPTFISGVSVNGKTKNALKLDGIDDNIYFDSGAATQTFTIAFWMSRQTTNGGNRNYIVEGRTGGGGNFYWLLDDNPLAIAIMERYDSPGVMTLDVWEHWAYTQTAGVSGILYRNGAVFQTYPVNPGVHDTVGGTMIIGSHTSCKLLRVGPAGCILPACAAFL